MAVTPQDVLTDPQFQRMSPQQKKAVLARIDPDFARLTPQQQDAIIAFRPGPSPEARERAQQQPPSMFQMAGVPDLSGAGATVYGAEQVAKGFGDVAQGAWGLAKSLGSAEGPVGAMGRSVYETVRELPDVPSAISDIWAQTYGTPYERSLQLLTLVGPRTLGGLAATAASEGAMKGLMRTGPAAYLQRTAGAGKELVELAEMDRLKAQAKYENAVREYNAAEAAKKAEHAQKVREARIEWAQKEAAYKQAQASSSALDQHRASLRRGVEAYLERLQENLKKTKETVKGGLDNRWDSLRKTTIRRGGVPTILSDELLNSTRIAQAIDQAERTILVGQPESLAVFRNILREIEPEAELTQQMGGQGAEAGPRYKALKWDEGRRQYTALGEKAYSGKVSPTVRKAIKVVRDEIQEQLKAKANDAGALPAYESLLKDWSQYASDWLDTRPETASKGSQLGQAVEKGVNPASLEKFVTGPLSDKFMERLGRYRNAGARMDLAEGARTLTRELEKPTFPTFTGPKEVPKPMPRAAGELRLPAEPKPGKAEVAPPPVDPTSLRLRQLITYGGRPITGWDLLPWRLLPRSLESFDPIRRWTAAVERREIPVGPQPPPRGVPALPQPRVPLSQIAGTTPIPGTLLIPAQATNARQIELVRNLQALYERQRAAGDPQAMATGLRLSQERSKLPQAGNQ